MKTPVCELCAVTGGLCTGCQRKLDAGEITQCDVDVARALYKLKDRFALGEAVVTRCFDAGNIVFLFTAGEAGKLIGKGGRVAGELKNAVGKHVRVVKLDADLHLLAEEVLRPVKPLGMNAVFHAGREVMKVRLPKRDAQRLPTAAPELIKVLEGVFAKPVEIAFE